MCFGSLEAYNENMSGGVVARRKRHLHRFQVPTDKVVLVGVLKRKRDLDILLMERWYRMPLSHAPVKPFGYLALYEPALFGLPAQASATGKRIRYYARVLGRETLPRKKLLPDEALDPRAEAPYVKLTLGTPQLLTHPIRNTTPRRVSFGFTTIGRLLTARNLLELYNVPPTEDIVRLALRGAGIPAVPQRFVAGEGKPLNRVRGKRYRMDFAIFCKKGKIAIECDNRRAHSSPVAMKHDREKDAFFRRHGWRVVRLTEHDITFELGSCLARLRHIIASLGGLTPQ